MIDQCTGVILAGGSNRRFPGKKKTFRTIGKEMILERIYRIFSDMFNEIIIVVNDPKEFAGWDMTVVTDIIPARCALSGLHAGLFHASYPYSFVTACDTPFLTKEMVCYILDQVKPGYDVIIPRTDDGLEPLTAVYSRSCLPRIEKNLTNNIFMIKKFFHRNRVREISANRLRQVDPDLRFSFNINTKEDFELAKIVSEQMAQTKD